MSCNWLNPISIPIWLLLDLCGCCGNTGSAACGRCGNTGSAECGLWSNTGVGACDLRIKIGSD
ncbi:hypothetical protein DPMN_168734 [Dreissena polymorpha]|uniref:Uncharacterized protein n=1 Tax=Dreissena polymorpha TaxID=45954 RepID=A0A9D4F735_DREPO|nr:hypothetical protein DPMN_168734 [Dreissena polymorpha]